jgi:uncharacterized protein
MLSEERGSVERVAGFFPPVPDHDSAPFWAALRDRRLIVQQCDACGTLRWPFRSVCANCRGRAAAERTISGTGTIYSWTIIHHATVDTPQSLLPYCVALVALDEDPRILFPAQFDGAHDELRAGLPVIATYHEATADVTVLHWHRISAASPDSGQRAGGTGSGTAREQGL